MVQFDHNIFSRSADRYEQGQQGVRNTVQNLANAYMKQQNVKDAKLEKAKLDALKPENIANIPAELQTKEQANILRSQLAYKGKFGVDPNTGERVNISPTYEDVSGAPSSAFNTLNPQAPAIEQPVQQAPIAQPVQAPVEQFPVSAANPLAATPKGGMMKFAKELEFDSNQMLAKVKAGTAKELTEKQKGSAQYVINRMGELNDKLRDAGAMVSEEGSNLDRFGQLISGTETGQGYTKVTDPKVQALREEYTNLQATFLPFYASAVGLSAKSIDSDGERKAILSSFGNPTGIHGANKNQLDNLSTLIGSGKADSTNAPEVGTMSDGYKFNGGDPKLESSWELVK